MPGRERLATRQRRQIYYGLQQGTLEPRRMPAEQELTSLFRAVDFKDLNAFGVRDLVQIELNVLRALARAQLSALRRVAARERADRGGGREVVRRVCTAAHRARQQEASR